jgi:dolichyl-phosphate beta-glucosyltransferase
MKISVVIPAYNEEKVIISTLDLAIAFFTKQGEESFEVIVVSDGSTDKTVSLVEDYSHPNVRLIDYQQNMGKGYAVCQGMLASKGESVLFMDADHSVDISHLEQFLPYLGNYDVVVGSIHLLSPESVTDRNPLWRMIIRKIGYGVPFVLLGIPVFDTQRGFKLFSRKAVDIIFQRQTEHGFCFDVELLTIAHVHDLNIRELPVTWHNPKSNHITVLHYLKIALGVLRIVVKRLRGRYV